MFPPLDLTDKFTTSDPPAEDLHVQKARLLENGGLVDFAVREIQAAPPSEEGNWMLAETARLYQDSGRYDRAIEVMKRGVPNYFAVDVPELPRPYWEALFPKAYWGDLKRFSSENELDPYLVASLIRQESEFNPNAISRANAVGLMQLLPVTGKKVAKEVKMHHFSPSQLYTPTVNLQLGTRYFKSMVDKFGSFEYALAAYNAGSDRVEDWLAQGSTATRRNSSNPSHSPRPANTCRPSCAMRMFISSCTETALSSDRSQVNRFRDASSQTPELDRLCSVQ